MLNDTTKRKINSLRDILVGKIPDPKSQVEQITNALIYKYMDDMDRQSEAMGGKASFFMGEYKKYSWRSLMDSKMGGQERMNLYVEALEKMGTNKKLSPIFRDILKGAFLPYRSPETLNMFLHEIDGFSYDHSEDLGDAFEYLLSIMGSQGDAGQFRTPRHIIDFMVEVVEPQKNETVLDPACGTAGFLISAYKHILKNNRNKSGASLIHDERRTLHNNFTGYDISPEMVKLSRVNMFLHNFPEPKIFEYDTLSSEERWNDNFDVILANPPFMSPKGGIVPHKKFSIQATRSEVLFVDYFINHLNKKGRAGIIVPEGIIFKSENSYKQLRKNLVEDGLTAVVSLPSGVFNPYAGVKTSILFFDNQLVKKSDEVLFVKISQDGYDLGAQRRKIEKDDLPKALEILKAWKNGKKIKNEIAHWVSKKEIAKNGDYNLSGDRYHLAMNHASVKWPMIELGEVLDYEQPTKYIVNSVNYDDKFSIPVLTAGKTFILGYTDEESGIFKEKLPVIIFDDFTTAIKFVNFPFKVKSSAMKILHAKKEKADIRFLFHVMQQIRFAGNEHKRYWISEYSKIKIPLPPLKIQEQIVAEIEVKQNAIKAAQEVIKNLEREREYFGQSLRKLKGVKWVELKSICSLEYGKPLKKENRKNGEYPVFGSNGVVGYHDEFLVEGPFIIVGRKGTAGAVNWSEKNGYPIDTTFYVRPKDKKAVDLKYLYYTLSTLNLGKINIQAGVPGLNRNDVYKVKIILPHLEIQKQLVAETEKEQEIIKANKKLIEIMELKITKVLEGIIR